MFKNRPSLHSLVSGLSRLWGQDCRLQTPRRTLACPERLESRKLFCNTEMSIAPWIDTAGMTTGDQTAEVSSPLPATTSPSSPVQVAASSGAASSLSPMNTASQRDVSNGRTMPVENSEVTSSDRGAPRVSQGLDENGVAGDSAVAFSSSTTSLRSASDSSGVEFDEGEFDDGQYGAVEQPRQIRVDTSLVTVGDNFFGRIGIDFDRDIKDSPTVARPPASPTAPGDSLDAGSSSALAIEPRNRARTTSDPLLRPSNLADLELLEDAAMLDAESLRLRQVDLSASLITATDNFFDRFGIDFDVDIDDRLRTSGGDIVSDSPRTPLQDVPRLSDSPNEGFAGRLLRRTKDSRSDSATVELNYNFDYLVQDLRRAGISLLQVRTNARLGDNNCDEHRERLRPRAE